jgi:hypothetical protein
MNALTRLAAMSFIVGFYVGCSPQKFSLDEGKCKDLDANCVVEAGKFKVTDTIVVGAGKVDILIVNDNSASMSFEQKRLAPRFQNFIQNLDAKKSDYRIAMTTTDVSSKGMGGKLLPFGSNAFLTPQVADRLNLFNATIQRPETRVCENFIANWFAAHGNNSGAEYQRQYDANCPSGDERGIYAANLAVKNNPSSFIRSDAHLAVIFLSDEDERSGLYSTDPARYPLEAMDQAGTLINNVRSVLGQDKFNSLSVHAIVVRDGTCLASQNSQVLGDTPVESTRGLVTGSIGTQYLKFTQTTPAWGAAADICSSDYTGQLGQIQTRIENLTKDRLLKCENPTDVSVTFSGSTIAYHVEGKLLKFDQYLTPGSSVVVTYSCISL